MGAVEYYARMLAAIALFLGLGWVCLVRHDLWSSMWGAATYFDLLLAHLGSTADSTIYLLEDSITEMEFLPWALYPASFPLGVCATVVLEVIRESNDYYVALKLAMALMLGGGLGYLRTSLDCDAGATMLLAIPPLDYFSLALPAVALVCAPAQYILIWRSPVAHLSFLLSFIFMPINSILCLFLILYILNFLDFNAYDFSSGSRPVLAYVPTGTTIPFEQVAGWSWFLGLIEMVIVLGFAWASLRRVLKRILLVIVSDSIDLHQVRRFDGSLPFKVQLLMWLSDDIDNSMRCVSVVTGGGKTTTAITAIEHVANLGGASIDKDALSSTRQESTSPYDDEEFSVEEHMRGADDLEEEEDDEDEPSVILSMLARAFGRRIVTGRERSEVTGQWFRARAGEIITAAKKDGVRDPKVLVLVHSPNDVRSCGLPIQSWCGVLTPLDAQVREVLDTRSRPVSEGGRGADIDSCSGRGSQWTWMPQRATLNCPGQRSHLRVAEHARVPHDSDAEQRWSLLGAGLPHSRPRPGASARVGHGCHQMRWSLSRISSFLPCRALRQPRRRRQPLEPRQRLLRRPPPRERRARTAPRAHPQCRLASVARRSRTRSRTRSPSSAPATPVVPPSPKARLRPGQRALSHAAEKKMSYDHLSCPYFMQVAADCLTGSFTRNNARFSQPFLYGEWFILRFPILSHGRSEISRIFPWMAPHDLWAPGWWKMAGPTATTPCGSCTKTWWPPPPGKGASRSRWSLNWVMGGHSAMKIRGWSTS